MVEIILPANVSLVCTALPAAVLLSELAEDDEQPEISESDMRMLVSAATLKDDFLVFMVLCAFHL